MNKELIREKARLLSDLSQKDWKDLKKVVDRTFRLKISEVEKTTKLSDCDNVDIAIRSIFG